MCKTRDVESYDILHGNYFFKSLSLHRVAPVRRGPTTCVIRGKRHVFVPLFHLCLLFILYLIDFDIALCNTHGHTRVLCTFPTPSFRLHRKYHRLLFMFPSYVSQPHSVYFRGLLKTTFYSGCQPTQSGHSPRTTIRGTVKLISSNFHRTSKIVRKYKLIDSSNLLRSTREASLIVSNNLSV